MSWHLRITGTVPVVISCLAVLLLSATLIGDAQIGLPALLGPGVRAPLITSVALAASVTLAYVESRRAAGTVPVAARPIRWIDAGGFTLLVTVLALAATVLDASGVWAARALIGGLGLTLATSRTLGARGAALPAVIWTIAGLVFGGPDGQPRWWAWQHQLPNSAAAWSAAVGLAVVGAVALLRPPRRIRD